MANSSLVERVLRRAGGADAMLKKFSLQERAKLVYDWHSWARPEQLMPVGDWLTWFIKAGRGFGKTRTGAESIRELVEEGLASRIGLVGRTPADVRDTMVEGESGILECCPPWNRPVYQPTTRSLTWPSGARALTFTSYEPDQLRGPQFDAVWYDELAAFAYLRETWDNGQLALRLGARPRQIVTTTPRPLAIIKQIMAAKSTVVTNGSTYDNLQNLAPRFREQVLARYEGTLLGRQEISGELIDDLPGALWKRTFIALKEAKELQRIVIAIDPASTSQADADETGIIACGVDNQRPPKGYVLGDYSMRGSPDAWARKAVQMYHVHRANFIVAESNQGGEMITQVIHTVDPDVPVKLVHASTGKHTRAEPVASLYEQGRIFHGRALPELEDQMCTWLPEDTKSPDRMDAMVWGFTELLLGKMAWILA